jgi:putative peptide zinc metalloprotease protein
VNSGPQEPGKQALPALREDIRLLRSRPSAGGAPAWTLLDPVAHAYFQIDIEAFQLIECWRNSRTADDLVLAVELRHGRKPDLESVQELIRFVQTHRLIDDPAGGWRGIAAARMRETHSPAKTLLHNYLFFKLPLVRPRKLLIATLPTVRLLASWPMLMLVACIGVTGAYLTSRRWDEFVGTFSDFWTPAGAAALGAALLLLKLCHELGHAYVATAKGCHVTSMGIAVMLGAPMPYTDVTDAWKLERRGDRMGIDLAGVAVELCIAALALFLWAFLPDGPARATAFLFATAALAMSIGVNLNPFMRFDGYFVLADMLNLPNLQPRAFALAKWRLRRLLFGVADSPPDSIDGRLRTGVIAYGFGVWLYRLVAFTGIALVVYHMFFKALGLLLFLIEIAVFIGLPMWRELGWWWRERRRIAATGRTLVTAAACAVLIGLAVVPWSGVVSVPAVIEPESYARVFPRAAGDVAAIHVRAGDEVKAGDALVELRQPRLAREAEIVRLRRMLLLERLDRRVADRKELGQTPQLEQELAALDEKTAALAREMDSLMVRAPVSGVVRELNLALTVGRSVGRDEEIAIVVSGRRIVARGYVQQDDLWRVAEGRTGKFMPDDASLDPIAVALRSASPIGAQTIEIPMLASVHGGAVETWPVGKNGELKPLKASHLVEFDIGADGRASGAALPGQVLRGTARIEGQAESLAAVAWRRILRVLVQESRF